MADKYYWIKLKIDFFSLDEIDHLLSQKNGSNYVVLYQMLCLMTINNNGVLGKQVGEMIVPYDVEKIARDTKYFTVKMVKSALEIYKLLGLVYINDDDCLTIDNYNEMVGSEVSKAHINALNAKRQKEYRARKKEEQGTN